MLFVLLYISMKSEGPFRKGESSIRDRRDYLGHVFKHYAKASLEMQRFPSVEEFCRWSDDNSVSPPIALATVYRRIEDLKVSNPEFKGLKAPEILGHLAGLEMQVVQISELPLDYDLK